MEEQEPHVRGKESEFNANFQCLMKFVAKHLKNHHIPHDFIRSQNLVSIMKNEKTSKQKLENVSTFIL